MTRGLRGWLRPRRRDVPVKRFDEKAGRWLAVDDVGVVDLTELTVTTFNIWNDCKHAGTRYLAIAELLSRRAPDVMLFQEVTPSALDVFCAQDWVRGMYLCASVVGGDAGGYGMLMLSRVPIRAVWYTRLPTRQSRGFLLAELAVTGPSLFVCGVHLDSGKRSSRLRAWQLHRIFRTLGAAESVVVLGDFNMREAEDPHIAEPYRDVWPSLRPGEDGFTEDTSINLMRYDMKNKHRHVRFDRILLKGQRWKAVEIELLGTEPIAGLPRVFPSDHFGVSCRLTSRNP